MTEAVEAKKRWRRLGADMFALADREARRPLDERLASRLNEYAVSLGVRALLAFMPLPDEPDIEPFLRRWLASGGSLALPVWRGGEACLLRRVDDLDSQLRPGRGGILEPIAFLPEASAEEFGLAVTPGRFFSENCDRLGRGAGVYDSLFRNSDMRRVGVAYDFQVFPAIPATERDIPMDAVVTPSRTITRFK